MGNRAVITTEDRKMGVYLHWDGDITSVTAFLTWCKMRGIRAPENDNYGWARLCQVIANYIEGGYCEESRKLGCEETFSGLSVGVDRYENIKGWADWDNGTYIIKDWEIVGREGAGDDEECDKDYFFRMLCHINERQPEGMRMSGATFSLYGGN